MSARPQRLQLSRRRGFSLQEHSRQVNGLSCVVVSRPTRWGNPFRVIRASPGFLIVGPGDFPTTPYLEHSDAVRVAVATYRANLLRGALGYTLEDVKRELRGYNLACWCPLPSHLETDWCHAATLLYYASYEVQEDPGG